MVINVGLLVFQKINLQNSVDLAAYYAAMKQAEVLNVIAHTNYQIRQSWKLLNFRYRGLGSAGNENSNFPLYCATQYAGGTGGCRLNGPEPSNPNAPVNCILNFCSNYQGWSHLNEVENYCKRVGCLSPGNIPLPKVPNSVLSGLIMPGLAGTVAATINLSAGAVSSVRDQCRRAARRSWITLATFIFAYKWDMMNRKSLIYGLSQGLSESESDFRDIDGQSVREGALKTFERNLSSPNLESFQTDRTKFRLINSLKLGGCGEISGGNLSTPNWLQPIYVRPLYRFVDVDCNGNFSNNQNDLVLSYHYFSDAFSPNPNDWPPNTNDVRAFLGENFFEMIRQITVEPTDFTNPQQMHFASTIGFEKNPWCMAYTMIEAETTPKIPFSPLGKITLKARAAAKPFGGNIGPWYAKQWPSGQLISGSFSTPPEMRTDKALTFRNGEGILQHVEQVLNRIKSGPDPARIDDFLEYDRITPNHGRYVGDTSGLSGYNTLTSWLDGVFNTALPPRNANFSTQHWLQIIDKAQNTGDILPWDDLNPNAVPLSRKLEIEAIIPDQFDLSYYSIESNFFDNYVERLRKNRFLIEGFLNQFPPDVAVRGDLGYRNVGNWSIGGETYDLSRFTIRDQFQIARTNRLIAITPGTRQHGLSVPGLGYLAKADSAGQSIPSLLTSWHMAKPGDYTFKVEKFGQCLVPAPKSTIDRPEIDATPGDCVAGGRAGYSVKLVDPNSLTEMMALGGDSTIGRIRNPPPN